MLAYCKHTYGVQYIYIRVAIKLSKNQSAVYKDHVPR